MKPVAKPHICFVAPDTWPVLAADPNLKVVGGAQVQQRLLATALARRGFRVSMICDDYGQPDLAVIDGVTVLKSKGPLQRLPVIRSIYPRLTGLWSAMRRADADVYYQRSAAAHTGVVGLFAKRHGRRFVYAAACDLDVGRDETRKLFQRRAGWRDYHLFRLGLTLATDVVVQHAQQMQEFMRCHGRAATIVPSCYAEQPRGVANSNGVVLWVSALRTGKRPELLLEMARRLPHLRFRMVGGPSSEAGGEAAFARMKEEAAASIPNLEFVGFVPFAEVHTHFNGARVFVNTSDYEGFPNTFLQSWSRGIPTVSFCDTGSIVDGVKVVNVANDLDHMTNLVSRLMSDDNYWREVGMIVRTCYERFHTPDAAVEVYERLFAKQWKETDKMRSQIRRAA
jgi:glycosyltransferase involved in cell wall biosynthesis